MSDTTEGVDEGTVSDEKAAAKHEAPPTEQEKVPAVRKEDPSPGAAEPSTVGADPAAVEKEPAKLSPEPSTVPADPASIEKDPSTISEKRSTLGPDPSTIQKDPSTISAAPEADGSVPATSPKDPSTIAEDPSTIQKDPSTISEKPSTIPAEPSTTPQDPAAISQDPDAIPQEPSTEQKDPATIAEEPSTEQKEPSTEQKEPSAGEAKAADAGNEPPAEAPAPEPEPRAPPPIISGLEPAAVGVKGGTVLTILGGDFAEGCSVLIDGTPVPGGRVHTGRMEAIVSKHEPGMVDVTVKNPDGQTATLAAALRYAEPPVVGAVSPAVGLTTGGYEVVISGRYFEAGCAVLFAGEPLGEVRFVNEGEVRVRAPAHHAEAVDVALVNPNGLAHRAPLAFAYETAPPRITSVIPDFGPNAGGTRVAVRGTDFDEKCQVYVCGIPATVSWKSREELWVVTPPVSRDGLVDVRVVNVDDQASTLDKAFRYDAPLPPPALTTVSPRSGSQVGGTKVSIIGEDFAEGVVVRFAGTAAEVKFLTRKELAAVTPAYAGAGDVDVEVVNPDGAAATLEKAFTYEARPAPSITSVSPPSGPSTGGTKLVIEGANFTKDAQVYVDREYPKDIQIKSATEIHIITAPRKTPGVVDVEVTAPGLPKAVAKNAFRYDAVPAPIITSVSPNAGAVAGGTEMTISGKNFRKDTAVLIDGKPPKAVKFIDAQTLEFKTPPGDAGKMVDVAVKNPDGKEAVQKRAFLYDPRYR
ncbi:MAG: IPT/TIG domain-containing protein [Minicystis sp.]